MKKLICGLIVYMCVICSCKKIYTCECTTTWIFQRSNGTFDTLSEPGIKAPYTQKLSSKQAKAACANEQGAIESNFLNAVTGNGNVPLKNGESVSTTCKLN